MSIWGTSHEIKAKRYVASQIDPRLRQRGDESEIDLAHVCDFVFDDNGNCEKILPYLRLGLRPSDTVLLTERAAKELRDALTEFIDAPKWRGKPRAYSSHPTKGDNNG